MFSPCVLQPRNCGILRSFYSLCTSMFCLIHFICASSIGIGRFFFHLYIYADTAIYMTRPFFSYVSIPFASFYQPSICMYIRIGGTKKGRKYHMDTLVDTIKRTPSNACSEWWVPALMSSIKSGDGVQSELQRPQQHGLRGELFQYHYRGLQGRTSCQRLAWHRIR